MNEESLVLSSRNLSRNLCASDRPSLQRSGINNGDLYIVLVPRLVPPHSFPDRPRKAERGANITRGRTRRPVHMSCDVAGCRRFGHRDRRAEERDIVDGRRVLCVESGRNAEYLLIVRNRRGVGFRCVHPVQEGIFLDEVVEFDCLVEAQSGQSVEGIAVESPVVRHGGGGMKVSVSVSSGLGRTFV